MKKAITVAMVAAITSIVLSVVVVKAADYNNFVGVELSAFSAVKRMNKSYVKEQDYVTQEYENIGTVNNLGGGKIGVAVKTYNLDNGTESVFLEVDSGDTKEWKANAQNANYTAGHYDIAFKTASITISGANHSGIWYHH